MEEEQMMLLMASVNTKEKEKKKKKWKMAKIRILYCENYPVTTTTAQSSRCLKSL